MAAKDRVIQAEIERLMAYELLSYDEAVAVHAQREREREERARLFKEALHRKRGRRERSMVYFIRSALSNSVKIGWTTTGPLHRAKDFCLPDITVLATEPGGQAREAQLHRRFARYRIGESEWFRYSHILLDYMVQLPAANLAHLERLRMEAGVMQAAYLCLRREAGQGVGIRSVLVALLEASEPAGLETPCSDEEAGDCLGTSYLEWYGLLEEIRASGYIREHRSTERSQLARGRAPKESLERQLSL